MDLGDVWRKGLAHALEAYDGSIDVDTLRAQGVAMFAPQGVPLRVSDEEALEVGQEEDEITTSFSLRAQVGSGSCPLSRNSSLNNSSSSAAVADVGGLSILSCVTVCAGMWFADSSGAART